MGAKARFLSLLTVLLLLTSLLMKGQEFSTPHKGNPEVGDILVLLISILYAVGLILILLLTYYYYDRFARKRKDYQVSSADLISVLLYLVVLPLLTLFFGGETIRISTPSKETAPGSLVSSNRTFHGVIASPNTLQTDLYLFALIPIIVGAGYISYHYVRLALRERDRKKKVRMAVNFDRKLEELGLDQFDEPEEAIIQIYKNAVLWLEGLGIPYQESWTHWEHAEHVNYMRSLYLDLVRLFEKAKYAPERVEWSDAEKAFEIYSKFRGKAREVAGVD